MLLTSSRDLTPASSKAAFILLKAPSPDGSGETKEYASAAETKFKQALFLLTSLKEWEGLDPNIRLNQQMVLIRPH